jgi:uncharacterized RDD family membrane protein YckC
MDQIIKPAGFWIRALAHFIDLLIVGIPLFLLSFFVTGMWIIVTDSPLKYGFQLAYLLVGISYPVFFLSSPWQATPGKRMVGVYIVQKETQGKISISLALGRYICVGIFAILMSLVSLTHQASGTDMTAEQQSHMLEITKKRTGKETVTMEDEKFMWQMQYPPIIKELTPEEQGKYSELRAKKVNGLGMTDDEFHTLEHLKKKSGFITNSMIVTGISILNLIYMLIISLMIGLTVQKTGLHDIICKTRALRGRPEKPIYITE